MTALHRPVMLNETIEALMIKPGSNYVDATFGRGGHTRKMLEEGARVYAFDHDQEAVEFAEKEFAAEIESKKLTIIRANFSEIKSELLHRQIEQVAGILFDFGTSVDQLTSQDRGFSFDSDAPLDMRMDDRLGVKAADLLGALSERELTQLFWEYGGEEMSRGIAKQIVYRRKQRPINTTTDLVKVVMSVKQGPRGKIHPATKVFQALRIAVNMEMESIEASLPSALEILEPQGRLVTIAFHDGEDRIVKHVFKNWELENLGTRIGHKAITPSEVEIRDNPRSRSAKLRIFEKK